MLWYSARAYADGHLPDLVAEVAAGNHSVDVQIDVRTMGCVQEKGKAEAIGTTGRNTIRELLILCPEGSNRASGMAEVRWQPRQGERRRAKGCVSGYMRR